MKKIEVIKSLDTSFMGDAHTVDEYIQAFEDIKSSVKDGGQLLVDIDIVGDAKSGDRLRIQSLSFDIACYQCFIIIRH